MNGLARLSTGTSPVRSSPSYSQSRPVSLLLHRPIEFTALDRPVWRQTGPNSGWLSFRLSGKDGDVHLPGRPRSRCVSVADLHVKNAFPPIDQALRKRDDDRSAGDHNAEAWRQLVCTRTSVIAREYGGRGARGANSARIGQPHRTPCVVVACARKTAVNPQSRRDPEGRIQRGFPAEPIRDGDLEVVCSAGPVEGPIKRHAAQHGARR